MDLDTTDEPRRTARRLGRVTSAVSSTLLLVALGGYLADRYDWGAAPVRSAATPPGPPAPGDATPEPIPQAQASAPTAAPGTTGTPAQPPGNGGTAPAAGPPGASTAPPATGAAGGGGAAAGGAKTGQGEVAAAAQPPATVPLDRLQHPANAALNTTYVASVASVGQVMTGRGAAVTMTPLYPWNSVPAQQWRETDSSSTVSNFLLRSGDGSHCLTATSPVTVAVCNTADARQRWRIVNWNHQPDGHSLQTQSGTQCLTAYRDAAVALEPCLGKPAQTWRFGTLS